MYKEVNLHVHGKRESLNWSQIVVDVEMEREVQKAGYIRRKGKSKGTLLLAPLNNKRNSELFSHLFTLKYRLLHFQVSFYSHM